MVGIFKLSKMSDGIGPTITLYKIKQNGMRIGGFTS